MANAWARDRARDFYLLFGAMALAAILIGFSTTYFLPGARGTLDLPWVVHAHGWLAIGWVLLLIAQVVLVRSSRTRIHRKLGLLALPLALAVWASGIATALWATGRELPTMGYSAYSITAGSTMSLTVFLLLVSVAVAMRRRPDWHKRLILLATIVVLWPAFFRFRHFVPSLPRPDIFLALLLANSPILIAAVRDKLRFGAVHPAWKWVGSAVFIEQVLEFVAFETGANQAPGEWLYRLLT